MKTTFVLLLAMLGLTRLNAQILTLDQEIVASTLPQATLANVSCRAYVGAGANVAIVGFVVTGQAGSGVQVLIRGVGPTLAQFGLNGVLAQPMLTLFDSSGNALASNTGWSNNSNTGMISSAATLVGAFALPLRSADSALLVSLAPGNYTAVVSGLNNTSGTALLEVYGMSTQAPLGPPAMPETTTQSGSG